MATDATHRVAMLLPRLSGGGAERVFLDLASEWVDQHEVDLVVMRKEGELVDHVPHGVRLVDLGIQREAVLGALEATRAFARYLRERAPRAVVSTLYWANLVALWGAWISRRDPRVLLRHPNMHSRIPEEDVDRVFRAMARVFYPRAERFVAVSSGVKQELVDAFGVPSERVSVVPNPVPVDRIREDAKAPLEHAFYEEGDPVVIGMGSLTRQKDFATLIDAFARVNETRASRLLILGEGPLRSALEERVRERGLEERVDLPGFVENPFPYLDRADVFALSSRWEGLPNVLLQALAVGTPSVSTDCPSGPDEILTGPLERFLCPVGDEEALAERILEALEDPPPNPVLQEAIEPFRSDRIANEYLELLTDEAP